MPDTWNADTSWVRAWANGAEVPSEALCAQLAAALVATGGAVDALRHLAAAAWAAELADACPDDPDGQHHVGCGCDYTSPDDPEPT